MAKKNTFAFETITSDESTTRRSQRGKRHSKYVPVGEQFAALQKDQVLAFRASKNEVQGVRNYMRRNFQGEHQVNSRRQPDDSYEVHISRADA